MAFAMVHQTPRAAAGAIDLSAYILPDGSLPVFCDPEREDTALHYMCEGCCTGNDFVLRASSSGFDNPSFAEVFPRASQVMMSAVLKQGGARAPPAS